jgi:hypothetical protein
MEDTNGRDTRVTLAEFIRNARGETVRIATSDFKGLDLIDLRVWYLGPDGELRPSAKGFAVKRELLPDLLDAVLTAAELLGVEGPEAKPGEWEARASKALPNRHRGCDRDEERAGV